VWASDKAQEPFIGAKMSTEMEPVPLFPNIGMHPAASAA
jgi:hypothetical protein